MATALFCYSIVARPRGGRGATKAELLAAILEPDPQPGTPFSDAEEIFNALTGEDGLGALEITTPANAPARYYLSIKQTLRMYYNASLGLVDAPARDKLVWDAAQKLARKGLFEELRFVDAPSATDPIDMDRVFEGVDSTQNRLIVLDPRRWTLLNGKDDQSRAEITALLGLGAQPMRMDNAASCVVAVVNTQRRDVARKRAGEVLAWRHVISQINQDEADEVREANAKLDEAAGKLNKDVEKAFQHYAYLVRAGELVVEFKRFDDDTKTSLHGDDLWTALVESSRATIASGLSATYLAALLDGFDRALTPKEVVQAFYKNPSFPLVPSTDDIRRAIYNLLHEGWELADSDGNALAIASPGQISINSINQVLRRRAATATPAATTETAPGGGPAPTSTDGEPAGLFDPAEDPYRADTATIQATPAPVGTATPASYKRYVVELANRSITSPEARDQVWQLLRELAKVVDTANNGADHQLLTLKVELTTAEGHQGQIETKANQAGARVRTEDDEF